MNRLEMRDVVDLCAFDPYSFVIIQNERGTLYLQGMYLATDIATGGRSMQHTRKWMLSEHMTKSEIVQTVFKCALTSMEHQAREAFKYRGKRVFGPHFDVDALHRICSDREFDYRAAPEPGQEFA